MFRKYEGRLLYLAADFTRATCPRTFPGSAGENLARRLPSKARPLWYGKNAKPHYVHIRRDEGWNLL